MTIIFGLFWIRLEQKCNNALKLNKNRQLLNIENSIVMEKVDEVFENRFKSKEEVSHYLKERVMPVLGPLQMDVLAQRPKDLKSFCVNWLKHYGESQKPNLHFDFNDDDVPDHIFKEKVEKFKAKSNGRRRCRAGVSGDITNNSIGSSVINLQTNDTNHFPEQTKINILMYLKNCIFFKNIKSKSLFQIITNMKQKYYRQGDIVIREGQIGNQFFLVDEGTFKCEVRNSPSFLKKYGPGQTFGELALLYNHGRASTITACTDGRVFVLGRQYFNYIVRETVTEKIKICEELVSKIEIFQSLNIYERYKLYETMEIMDITKEKYVIREGEIGDCFYIVAEGQLVAYKLEKNGESKLVYTYQKGDYFGQLSLMKNVGRQASVKSLSECKLIYIDRATFKRILGPLESILRRNEERYEKMKVFLSQEENDIQH